MRGPLTEFYRCRDGRWFMLAILNQVREWPLLAQVVGHPELLDDPRYATSDLRKANGEALLAVLESAFATRDWQDWKQALDQAGITTGAASLPQDHLTCPQVAANNMLPEMADHSGLRTIDSPIHIEGEVKRPPARAPEIGEHSQKVLADFGYTTDQIDRLVNNGAIGLFKS